MIQRIVFTKLQSGQIDESGLEMVDLRIIINRMADTLVNMHHHRIKYQWQAQRAQEFGVPESVVRDSAPDIEVHRPETGAPPPTLPAAEAAAPMPDLSPVPEPPAVAPVDEAPEGEAPSASADPADTPGRSESES